MFVFYGVGFFKSEEYLGIKKKVVFHFKDAFMFFFKEKGFINNEIPLNRVLLCLQFLKFIKTQFCICSFLQYQIMERNLIKGHRITDWNGILNRS